MWLTDFLTRPRRSRRTRPAGPRPRVLALEDRSVPGFLASVAYTVNGAPDAVATGDFNRDGAPDLAVANGYGWVSVLLGNGNGSFRAGQGVGLPSGTLGVIADSVVVGDLNADGKLDLVAGGRAFSGTRRPPGVYEQAYDIDTSAFVVLGNGDGTFQAPRAFATDYAHMPPDYSVPSSVAVGDLNGDGTLDIAVTSRSGIQTQSYYPPDNLADHVTVLIGRGDGTFSANQTTALGGAPGALVTGDFNTDGHLDLLAAGGTLLLGGGDGTLQASGTGSYGDSAAVADFNGDGHLDLAVGVSWGDGGVGVHLGNGDGTFRSGSGFGLPMPTAVAVGDFNRDGRLDLAAAQGTGQLTVLLGDGTGGFQPQAPSPAGAAAYGLAVGDFNGDLFPDAATANRDAGTAAVLVNNGSWTSPPVPQLAIGDASAREGNTGQTVLRFGVTLSAPAGVTVTVQWATADGTATSGADYQGGSGTLFFLPGQTTKTIDVAITGDRIGEPDETIFVNLTQPTNAGLADGQGRGTIVDDEPRITISDVAKREGRSGTTLFVFTVRLSTAYDQPVTVNFSTADGTATAADHDYQPMTGTLTFAPGQTSATISVAVYGDRTAEGDETFTVNLGNPSGNALLVDPVGLGTILNDDR